MTPKTKAPTKPDWKMLTSEIEIELLNMYSTKSLDTSDQSKWGEEYKRYNQTRTETFNEAFRLAIQAYSSKLLNKLEVK